MEKRSSHRKTISGKPRNDSRGMSLLLILLLAALFCFSGYRWLSVRITEGREKAAFDSLSGIRAASMPTVTPAPDVPTPGSGAAARTGEETAAAPEPSSSPETAILPEYAELYAMNGDLFGWLRADAIGLDYPVMLTSDRPWYYLNRDYYGKASAVGVPFVDEGCPADGNYYLIYGHHPDNGTIFGQLEKYADAAFCRENPLILFDTLTEHRQYQVMAVLFTEIYPEWVTDVFKYYEYKDLTEEATFNNYVRQVKANSAVDTGVTAAWGDELLTLSTCSWHTIEGRVVVVAKRIK